MTPRVRAAAAEFIGTAALLVAVVGSGIMAERLSAGNAAVALLANALATGLALYVLITILAPVSDSHFNPVVTLAQVVRGQFPRSRAVDYLAMQTCGSIAGVWVAHLMFDLPVLQLGGHARTGAGQWLAEIVATAGLLLTITGCSRYAVSRTAVAVGSYIAAAYWFTSSTSFANPAVTVARALTDTFAGIRPSDAVPFLLCQLAGGGAGMAISNLVFGAEKEEDERRRPPRAS